MQETSAGLAEQFEGSEERSDGFEAQIDELESALQDFESQMVAISKKTADQEEADKRVETAEAQRVLSNKMVAQDARFDEFDERLKITAASSDLEKTRQDLNSLFQVESRKHDKRANAHNSGWTN